jgi:hypothetical protein
MNTKSKFTRFVFALLLALSALGITTSTALADKPTKWEFSLTNGPLELVDVCSFPISITVAINISGTEFVDQNGVLIRSFQHSDQQDTFTANGKTLVGIPYTYNIEILYDSNGAVTHLYADGVIEKVPLPDGSLFISAGRVDFTDHPGAIVILSPDHGNPGNIEGFCAALAP